MFAIVARLKADGIGIVYISHKMDEFRRIADRVTTLPAPRARPFPRPIKPPRAAAANRRVRPKLRKLIP